MRGEKQMLGLGACRWLQMAAVVVALLVAGLGRADEKTAETPGVSRDIVVKRMCDGLLLSQPVKDLLPEDAQKALLRGLREHLVKVAPEILPELVVGAVDPGPLPKEFQGQQVGQRRDQPIPRTPLVTSTSLEAESAEIEVDLREILLSLAFQRLYRETVTPETLESLRGTVARFSRDLAPRMKQQLIGDGIPYDEAEIDAQLELINRSLSNRIGITSSYVMTRAISDDEYAAILASVDRALADQRAQILGNPDRAAESINKFQVGAKEYVHRLQISSRLMHIFLKSSSDPRLTTIKADDIIPGYKEARDRASKLSREARQADSEKRDLEREARWATEREARRLEFQRRAERKPVPKAGE